MEFFWHISLVAAKPNEGRLMSQPFLQANDPLASAGIPSPNLFHGEHAIAIPGQTALRIDSQ